MQIERNCNMAYPYMPMMPLPYQYPSMDNTLEQRIASIEKRLSILESNLNGQNISSNMMSNYQVI